MGSRLRWSRWAALALGCGFGALAAALLAAAGWGAAAAFARPLVPALRDVTITAGGLCLMSWLFFGVAMASIDRSVTSRLRRRGLPLPADVRYVLDLTGASKRYRWANVELCLSLHLPDGGTRVAVYSGIVAREFADRLLTKSTCSVLAAPNHIDLVRILMDEMEGPDAPATAYVVLSVPATQSSVSRAARQLAAVDRIRAVGRPGTARLVGAAAHGVTDEGDLVLRVQAVIDQEEGKNPPFLATWRQRVAVSARPLVVTGAALPCRLTGVDRRNVALELPSEINPAPPQPPADRTSVYAELAVTGIPAVLAQAATDRGGSSQLGAVFQPVTLDRQVEPMTSFEDGPGPDRTANDDHGGDASGGNGTPDQGPSGPHPRGRRVRTKHLVAGLAIVVLLAGIGDVALAYRNGGPPIPEHVTQAQTTTVYYNDGRTIMAKLGPGSQGAYLAQPTGLVVEHVLAELRATPPFQGKPKGFIETSGFQIITTISKPAEDAAIRYADLTQPTAPSIDRNQSSDWQAALASVEPGTGRVIAYYGGARGDGADFAGWYYDENGVATGYGAHPPGSTFKVYDMVTALKEGWSLQSVWYSGRPGQAVAFPQYGRGADNPIRNADQAPCMPNCTMSQAAIASLSVPFFDITANLGAANVLATARDAGIDDMWDGNYVRRDLRTADTATMVPNHFGIDLGIGQYPVTVLDQANAMATMAAKGKRAQAHFVKEVIQKGLPVYSEALVTTDLGVTPGQFADLDATLVQVTAGHFSDTWQCASKTGEWGIPVGNYVPVRDVWTVGYTNTLATAVWLGTKSGRALDSRQYGLSSIYGNNFVGPIFRAYMADMMKALFPNPTPTQLHFDPATNTGTLNPVGSTTSPGSPASAGTTPAPASTTSLPAH
jgi:hypothetical protein